MRLRLSGSSLLEVVWLRQTVPDENWLGKDKGHDSVMRIVSTCAASLPALFEGSQRPHRFLRRGKKVDRESNDKTREARLVICGGGARTKRTASITCRQWSNGYVRDSRP